MSHFRANEDITFNTTVLDKTVETISKFSLI